MIQRFRKKPVEIEAMQWDGSEDSTSEVCNFAGEDYFLLAKQFASGWVSAAKVYDELHATWINVEPGDWIIRGIRGEFYACKSDVFEATYELVLT